jgi:hypothetical protein
MKQENQLFLIPHPSPLPEGEGDKPEVFKWNQEKTHLVGDADRNRTTGSHHEI